MSTWACHQVGLVRIDYLVLEPTGVDKMGKGQIFRCTTAVGFRKRTDALGGGGGAVLAGAGGALPRTVAKPDLDGYRVRQANPISVFW